MVGEVLPLGLLAPGWPLPAGGVLGSVGAVEVPPGPTEGPFAGLVVPFEFGPPVVSPGVVWEAPPLP